MLLAVLPIHMNNKKSIQKYPRETYVNNRVDEGGLILDKNSSVKLNFQSANSSFNAMIILENNDDKFITKKEVISWYDPITVDVREKREAISYIIDHDEL